MTENMSYHITHKTKVSDGHLYQYIQDVDGDFPVRTFYPIMRFIKVSPDVPTPKYAHEGDAGIDLCSTEDVTLAPGETKLVGTGVIAAIPENCVGILAIRSGWGSKGLTLASGVGIIDSGYRGEIKAPLHNNHPPLFIDEGGDDEASGILLSQNDKTSTIHIRKDDRVCQLVIVPFAAANLVEVADLDVTERGTNGFGSSGRL